MNAICSFINLLVFIQIATCRDFYLGMFRRNDFLVAQDVVYKAPSPFGYTTASYGRVFKCPITYFRVVDRLGMGRGPITTIVRGGLRKKFITVRIKSTYRHPVSVNIYVGCENKKPSTFRTTLKTTTSTSTRATTKKTPRDDVNTTTISGGNGDETTAPNGGPTTDGKSETDTTGGSDTTENSSGTTSSNGADTSASDSTTVATTGAE